MSVGLAALRGGSNLLVLALGDCDPQKDFGDCGSDLGVITVHCQQYCHGLDDCCQGLKPHAHIT